MNLVVETKNRDDFLKARFVSGNFLQSSIWQDFLNKQGLRSWRATVLESDRVIATCLFYEKKLPLDRSYLYAPKGPVFSQDTSLAQKKEALELILSKARDVTVKTKRQEEIFFRLEIEAAELILKRLKKTPDIQPRDTWVLDLKAEVKDLLADMHAKTRYNIALAKRKGVEIEFSTNKEMLKDFLRLNRKTASRQNIVTHSDKHYDKLFDVLLAHQAGELVLAKVKGQVVAANILIYFAKSATYLHGASDYNFRKHMAPQALQWASIKRAKEKGCELYDFWGIAPEDGSKPAWSGITRFKKSFGGRIVLSPGTYDLIYNKSWYNLYNLGLRLKYLFKK